jgi:hypothetical protein
MWLQQICIHLASHLMVIINEPLELSICHYIMCIMSMTLPRMRELSPSPTLVA